MRDLSRARDDLKAQERKARQQLNAFLLRHGQHWPSGKTRWTPAHEHWLAELKMDHPWQQVVLQEYIDAERAAGERVAQLTDHLMHALPEWSQMLLRALMFRLAVHALHPLSSEETFPGLLRTAALVRMVL